MAFKPPKRLFYLLQLNSMLAVLFCLLLSLSFIPSISHADTSRLLIVKSEDSEFYNNFTTKLSKSLKQYCPQNCLNRNLDIVTITAEQLKNSSHPTQKYRLTITLGVKAQNLFMTKATSSLSDTVLHAMVPQHLSHHDFDLKHYSLVLDQPYTRVLALHQQIVNQKKPIGVIYTHKSLWRIDEITQAANQLDFNVKAFKIDLENKSLGESLSGILNEVISILMIPDKSLYNRSTVNEILLTGYLNQTPFIGYSKALAKTGALASVITPPDSIITDITNLVVDIHNGKTIETVNYPSKYRLIINEPIYKSLGIDISPKVLNSENVEVIN